MNAAVIFAGGVGSRMHSKDIPKQFLFIHDKPIIVRTVEHFQRHDRIDVIVVVCVSEWVSRCRRLLQQYGMTKVVSVVEGGQTGQESIYHGLCEVERIAGDAHTIVLIHDGVRPLITKRVIDDNIDGVLEKGSAITCVRAKETVLMTGADGEVAAVPDRSTLWLARAPQSFWLNDILDAHRDAIKRGRNDYVDSASMMFERGFCLNPVEGPDENIKVTTPGDFFSLQAIYNARENEQIYGI